MHMWHFSQYVRLVVLIIIIHTIFDLGEHVKMFIDFLRYGLTTHINIEVQKDCKFCKKALNYCQKEKNFSNYPCIFCKLFCHRTVLESKTVRKPKLRT